MVDFRYHIVSIVAIFLALAIGIVLGAGPLKTTSDAGLKTQVSDLRQARNTVQANLATAQDQVRFLNSFGSQVGPAILGGRLAGLDVAVVEAPGASSSLTSGLITGLAQAGAFVSVKAQIGGNWTDPDKQAELAAALAAGRVEPSSSATPSTPAAGRTPPITSSAAPAPSVSSSPTATADPNLYLDAGVDLAHALLTSATSTAGTGPARRRTATSSAAAPSRSAAVAGPALTGSSLAGSAPLASASPTPRASAPVRARGSVDSRILGALETGGFVTLTAAVPRHHPTLAVVVAADPPQTLDDTSRAATQVLFSLAEGLREGSDGTVVAGDAAAAGTGGLLSLIRASKPGAGGLSTVDSTDTPAGRIAVPLALVEQQAGGRVGQYGQVGTTDGPLPRVAGIGPG